MAKTSKRRSRAKAGKTLRRSAARRRPKTRAIETALAGIAHEIRTPLTGILSLAELLAASNLGERERQWAAAIKSGAEHLSAMTTLIVDAAKADAARLVLRRQPFSPSRLAEAVGRALTARAETKGLEAEIDISPALPAMAEGDELRLRAALENLADNAVKFTERGKVSLAASSERAGKRIRLVFTVVDSGIGLSKQDAARLFRPFRQGSEDVARRFGGAGLGLVFVRRVARAMGGDLVVTGTRGHGSTFRLTVLVGRFERDAPADERPRASGRSLRILCAEDNPYGRVVMNTILTELGHRTDFVDNGEAAVNAVARGGYDLVLMDVTLPQVDGVEAARRIRALSGTAARTPIIGISGRTEAGDESAARAAGMNFYFTKPVSPARLVEVFSSLRDD